MSIIAGVLPKLQGISEGEMLDAVTIHRPGAATSNEYGAMVPGAASNVSTTGRISPVDATDLEAVSGGEIRQEGLEKLTVPRATDVRGSDTVTVVSARHGTTKHYTVEGVLPLSTFSVHRKVLVRVKTV